MLLWFYILHVNDQMEDTIWLYTVQSETCLMINHCDRHITLLSETDIFFDLFNLFTYFLVPFG